MYATLYRRDHLAGVLLGTAIGDALGEGYAGLHRRSILRCYHRRLLQYRYVPARGVYGEPTRQMLLAAQALLNSCNEWKLFRLSLARRLSWYPFSVPVGLSSRMLRCCFRSPWTRWGLEPGIADPGDVEPSTRAVFLGIALHGAGHRLASWQRNTTPLTHRNPVTIDACVFLCSLANAAAIGRYDTTGGDGLQKKHTGPRRRPPLSPLSDPAGLMQAQLAQCTQRELVEPLERAAEYLHAGYSTRRAAALLGWDEGIPRHIVPVTVMSSYAFLRHSSDFQRAVHRAIGLGGATQWLGAVTGGLAGGFVGGDALPQRLIERLAGAPHDRRWMLAMAERFSHWPHGADDLSFAPAQPSDPLLQVARNVFELLPAGGHFIKRLIANKVWGK